MEYFMLLWPHANVRYQNESLKLAQSELRLMLDVFMPQAEICAAKEGNLPALKIRTLGAMPQELLCAIRRHSLMYALFETRDDGLMRLAASRAEAYIGADLPGILKYKGKTNELFLQLLINAALYSGGFARRGGEALTLLDPMCGRATALFAAANYGWNTAGTDVDKKDLSEAEKFLKRYFEFHHMKYDFARESRTIAGTTKAAPAMRFAFSDCVQRYKAGDTRTMQLVLTDAANVRAAFGKEKFHLIVCDLPYSVQHTGVGGSVETLLQKALPVWRETLKKGGTVALSFNAQTLKRDSVRAMLADAGLEVKSGGVYDEFSHWVEQAVTRDIAVARRTN